jgi:hypothetical protein
MKQANDDDSAASPRIPPGNFNLIDHPFRPTRDYQPIPGFSDKVRALEEKKRFRSALDEIFKVLDSHPGHPEALMLAMILLGEGRTELLCAEEPIPEAYKYDTRLDPIYAVCSHCRRKEWVPEAIAVMQYAHMMVMNPVGLQCYNCGYVVCRDCLQDLPSGIGLSLASRTCPNCFENALDTPVFPTGRRPHQMTRHTASVVHVVIFREGPIPPDDQDIQKLLEIVSPDILENIGTSVTAFPIPSWSDDIDRLADAVVMRMEADGKLPPGGIDNTEHAHVRDGDGIRSLVVKVMQKVVHYDLTQLGLPKEGQSFEEALEDQKKDMARQIGGGSAAMYINCQDLAMEQGVNSPVVRSLNGRAFVVLRLDGLSPVEMQQMREATEQSRVLLVPILALCPTYPVLSLKFVIYDDLTNPYTVEGPRGIHDATIQYFLQALLQDGSGDFYLYVGPDAEPLGSGGFSLRMPPFHGPGYPYRTQPADLENFWRLLASAAKYLESIPVASRDFQAAVRFYLEHTP